MNENKFTETQVSVALYLAAFASGKITKVETIKYMRDVTYMGLKECKDVVDYFEMLINRVG